MLWNTGGWPALWRSFVLLAAAPVALCGCHAVQLGQLNAATALTNFNQVRLAGDVVDEQGRPLQDVMLYVSRGRNVSFGKTEYTREDHPISGKFDVTASMCANAEFVFMKKGYFRETVFVRSGAPDSERLERLRGQDNRLRIVMLKVGRQTGLREYTVHLQRNADGSALVADLLPIANDNGDQDHRAQARRVPVTRVGGSDLPAICMSVSGDVPADRSRSVKNLTLTISGKDSGIQRAPCRPGRLIYLELRRAPQTGYASELNFAGAKEASDYRFYCRIGGRYGRGDIYLEKPIINIGDPVKATVRLEMQRDGTTNLETHGESNEPPPKTRISEFK